MKEITVGMHEAKTTLSQLVKKVRSGQEVVIANHGEPVAKLVPYSGPHSERKPGRLAGQLTVEAGFDELPAGFEAFAD
jgi:prevent-host-death family protein